jgi:VIT1/CCC1 family predicted Fe2+/Mn2+ transporter
LDRENDRVSWRGWLLGSGDRGRWSERARESILDANEGIVTAAGIAEGFASAGASTSTLLFTGAAVILAGGLAAAGRRYSEERTEWEMNLSLLEAERASIEADPVAEFEELVGIYEAKGLSTDLARQVAEAFTVKDPVAAHADVELNLGGVGSARASVYAGLTGGVAYSLGAILPLAVISLVPVDQRIELTFAAVLLALALTGGFASSLTGLPVLRLVRRNLVLGVATMTAALVVGSIVGL